MRTEQITITFPKKKTKLKTELMRLKEEDNLNVSSFVLSLIEAELGGVGYSNKFNTISGG
tara:strand:+ start:201 stop:380 length:180 start_codon:yes stop_codon:yes gene_type:complete